MCYAIPGRVTGIEGRTVTVDYYGESRKALCEKNGINVGDYVYAQGGYVLTRVGKEEAESVLTVWKDLFFELQETDVKLSRIEGSSDVDPYVMAILDRASQELPLSPRDLETLLSIERSADREMLFKTANFLRHKYLGNSCCVHGIIEYSNYCSCACAYCGINSGVDIPRYRMTDDEVMEAVHEAVTVYGFKALVLQGGEDPDFGPARLAALVRRILSLYPVLIFVSPGEVGIDNLSLLYQAGARGLLMRFETSNPGLYSALHPGSTLESRLEHLRAAYGMGYLVLTGSLIGLPDQTDQDLAQDILLAKSLHAEMFSFGPFLPAPGTPLALNKPVEPLKVSIVLAVSRLADPRNAKILVTTGFETLSAGARNEGLMAGANSVMLNVTPGKYKSLYSIYPSRAHIEDPLSRQIDETLALLKSLGRAPTDLGIS